MNRITAQPQFPHPQVRAYIHCLERIPESQKIAFCQKNSELPIQHSGTTSIAKAYRRPFRRKAMELPYPSLCPNKEKAATALALRANKLHSNGLFVDALTHVYLMDQDI
jgi:hypothetical protein